MSKSILILLIVMFFYAESSFAYEKQKTSTGFYWPIGIADFDPACGTWLGRDKANGGCYWKGLYHIGVDMMTRDEEHPVYAIAKGKIFEKHCIDSKGREIWGPGNCALFIRHEDSEERTFTALYGHIRTKLKKGASVNAGEELGTTGPYDGGVHLHFGIRYGDSLTPSPWGRLPNSKWDNTNDFIDPISFLNTHHPARPNYYEFFQVYKKGSFDTVDVAWYPPDKSCEKADMWMLDGEVDMSNVCSCPPMTCCACSCRDIYERLKNIYLWSSELFIEDKWERIFFGDGPLKEEHIKFCQ